MAADRAYEARFRGMAARAKVELAAGPAGTRARWWERDAQVEAAVAARRRKEKFDLVYPHVPGSREGGRKKMRRREGLKVPGKLKPGEANRAEQLVPIRLEFDVEHHKYRDTFVWNLNDPIVTPEVFAQSVIDDYGLSSSYHATITKSIQEQLASNDVSVAPAESTLEAARGTLQGPDAEWWASWRKRLRNKDGYVRTRALLQSVPEPQGRAKKRRKFASAEDAAKDVRASLDEDSSVDVEMIEVDEDKMYEEMRIIIKLDITAGEMKLDDQFEWDIENAEPTPEQFAEIYSSDLGLAGEFKTAIAHSIREQVSTYQKSLFLVGHPSDGSAVQDDDLRMSFLPSVAPVARSVDQTQSCQPIINYLSDGELDRLDKEREKEANKRRKRNTRGRRGVALPDREPLKTHRTPAIGFPEVDPSTIALAAAAAAPTSRRAAAAAASVTIANMVASENGTAIIPTISSTPSAPAVPLSKVPKAKGSFKAPKYTHSILKARANATAATPSTVVDASTFEPPLEGDLPLPVSSTSASAPDSKASRIVSARRQRELEKEAKEREYADGQRANMIDGIWHCSNCGCPDSIAVGRRKGPLGDKSTVRCMRQILASSIVGHDLWSTIPAQNSTSTSRWRSSGPRRAQKSEGGAAALRALNIQQDQAPTPSSMTDDQSSPTVPKHEVWVEIKSPKKTQASPTSDAFELLERPLSPASSVSSSASERPLAQTVLQNGTSGSRQASSTPTPLKAAAELPAQPEPSSSAREPAQSEPPSTSGASVTPVPEPTPGPTQGTPPPRPPRPQWLEDAMSEMQTRYPEDRFDVILRRPNGGNPQEWRVKCLDCPGKLYTPGPGETLTNYEVHLKNRQHRAKVHTRVHGTAPQ
ncbi:hypothetical protein DFH11DRAFT_484764 [Phellopilus nigrolimitatus]|nr:hypothetical protein DFH11DRAFT_484764 [Phellopilus nigrolimitatus]